MTGSLDDLESTPGPSADCMGPLEATAAGCVQHAESETGSTTERPNPPATAREFEHALYALGYSRRQAKAIARVGFRPAMAEPEAERDPDMTSLVAALQRRAAALKGKS